MNETKIHIIIKKQMKSLYYFIILIISSIIISSYSLIESDDLDESKYSYITLKISDGNNNIYSNAYSNDPKIVYINENKMTIVKFNYSFEESENSVILIWEKPIKNCGYIFQYCDKIIEMDLTHFDTSEVKVMLRMFEGCKNLKYLNISNLDTSNVVNMGIMFGSCSSLTSIDLSNFKTSKNKNIGTMFQGCSSLISINLSNFDTSEISCMDNLFNGCSKLTSIDLSNFDTSNVIKMEYMFKGCISLTSIKISNFNTKKVQKMDYMFNGCTSLISLDFQNLDLSSVETINNMFSNCPNLEYINIYNYIENNIVNNFNKTKLALYENMFYNMPDNAVLCINENNISENIFLQIKNEKFHFIDCSNDWKLKQNLSCSINDLSDNVCKFGIDFYQIENDSLNIGELIFCYKEPKGYYLDNNLYKKCYHSCETCNKEGNYSNHNCIECNENFLFVIKKEEYFNCYENCNYYYYFDKENNFHCTNNFSCPKNYPILNKNNSECIGYNFEYIKDIINNEKNDSKKISREEEIKYYDNILNKIEEVFESENFNTLHLDNGNDEVIKTEKVTITLTTTENQKNNIYKNTTTIDLGECETLLRNFYNIPSNEILYMKKIDIVQEGMKALKVEYDVYCKLFGTNLIKLNLTVCETSKILISIPIVINEDLDKYNISNGYYNDICYTTTSEDGTDISLKDRQKEYITKDKIICQEDCDFSEYDSETSTAKCSCKAKESSKSIADMNINKVKILENFKDIKNLVNFNFLICYKKLFNKKGIINNIGFYLILVIIIFHIINILIFSLNNFHSLIKKIKKIASKINQFQPNKKDEKVLNQSNKFNSKEKIVIFRNNKRKIKKIKKIKNNIDSKNNIKDSQINIDSKIIINNQFKIKNIHNFIDVEINELSYNLAIRYDKRTFCQYYISLLKTQHSLLYVFFNNNDYNSGTIKIDLFFISFTIEYTINALFYNDDTMHKIYESKGLFDIETQLPIIIYSSLISMILNSPLNFLALSNDAIINFKQSNIKINIMKRAKMLKNKLRCKFILFYIISFLLLLFIWYYISLFCVIYKNTQIHLLKDTLMSLGLSIFNPFILYLFPGFFRIPSLSNRKNKKECLYNFSKFLHSF